jgi:hypothetical protein
MKSVSEVVGSSFSGRLVKVKTDSRSRRFRVTKVDYRELRQRIENLIFPRLPLKEFLILFEDDDHDTCIVSNQAEWEDAMQCTYAQKYISLKVELLPESRSKLEFPTNSQSVPTPNQVTDGSEPMFTFGSHIPSKSLPYDSLSWNLNFPSVPKTDENVSTGPKFDIGVWNGNLVNGSPLTSYLMDESFASRGKGDGSELLVLPEELKLPFSGEGYFEVQHWEQHKLLSWPQMDRLCSFLDFYGGTVKEDFQVQFKDGTTLEKLLDTDDTTVGQLFAASTLINPKLVLRRTGAPTEGCIDFHTDVSESTVQITLNGDDEYVGGRLMYVNAERNLFMPNRPRGTMTKHNKHIYHGVSKLISGVRYSLFLIDSPSSVAMTATMDHVSQFLLREQN